MSEVINLLELKNKIKREPEIYKEEFLLQYQHFTSQLQIYMLKPPKEDKDFSSLVGFLAQVAECYPEDMKDFPTHLSDLLDNSAKTMSPRLRKACAQSLILLRSRNLLAPTSLVPLFFKLFHVQDKPLRDLVRSHIISDINRVNHGKASLDVKRKLQNYLCSVMSDTNSSTPREALKIMINLFKKGSWRDERIVNAISQGVFLEDYKMIMLTMKFFLSPEWENVTDEDKDEESPKKKLTKKAVMKELDLKGKARMTKAKKHKLKKKMAEVEKEKKRDIERDTNDQKQYNYEAMLMIYKPQEFAEKVFQVLKKCRHSYDVKLTIMNFLSRLIAANKIILKNYYSFMHKYVQPHQLNITQLLAILVQSIHKSVPEDIVLPLLKHVANTFVTDRRPAEVVAIGLNTIREMCIRAPKIMDATLLRDLLLYHRSKDKGVAMAAKSLITAFRAIDPQLLPKKQRGRLEDTKKNRNDDNEEDNEKEDSWEYEESIDEEEIEGSLEANNEGSNIEENNEEGEENNEENSDGENDEMDGEEDNDGENIDDTQNTTENNTIENDDEQIPELVKLNRRQKRALAGISKKRKAHEMEEERDIGPEDIEAWKPKRKRTKEERIESMKEGREDNKYIHARKRVGTSRTNIEKKKNKPYQMMRQKAKSKLKRTIVEKQKAKSNELRVKKRLQRRKHM